MILLVWLLWRLCVISLFWFYRNREIATLWRTLKSNCVNTNVGRHFCWLTFRSKYGVACMLSAFWFKQNKKSFKNVFCFTLGSMSCNSKIMNFPICDDRLWFLVHKRSFSIHDVRRAHISFWGVTKSVLTNTLKNHIHIYLKNCHFILQGSVLQHIWL